MVLLWDLQECDYFTIEIDMSDIDEIIASGGVGFKGAPKRDGNAGKVKTKAKKKGYITGAHGSGSARQKAKYREQRSKRR